jgi:hypothetical protein
MTLLKRQYGTDGFDDWLKQNGPIKCGTRLLQEENKVTGVGEN